ncbi:YraN family protein [Thiomicrorhabdus sp. Kp2]|uniref:YraN family protein n=1 Tax=Thiomicrorhabdus sp. Kp2 TaxID=1123518 RepID=UPI00041321A9|nr:YraN family protein [Thiomicrorhabdus sp. Kp2]
MSKLSSWFSIGHQKEQQAKHWLAKRNIQILAENFHCKGGEIDLIGLQEANHKEETQLIFFEVKYRKQTAYGHPSETVTVKKQQHIILCAQNYLLKNPQYQELAMRFDVLSFTAEQSEPEWIQDAFQAG